MVGDQLAIFLERVTFAALCDIAYTQLRHYGAADVIVAAHLIDGMRLVAGLVPEAHRAVPADHARLALETALKQELLDEEKDALRNEGAWIERRESHPGDDSVDPAAVAVI